MIDLVRNGLFIFAIPFAFAGCYEVPIDSSGTLSTDNELISPATEAPPGASNSSSSSSSSSARVCSFRPDGILLDEVEPISDADPNTSPVMNVDIQTHGLTVFVDGSSITDAEGDFLHYGISFGGKEIPHHSAWHTYRSAGEYTITVVASDGRSESRYSKTVLLAPDEPDANRAPIASAVFRSSYGGVPLTAYGYDPEGDQLSYEWILVSDQCGRRTVHGERASASYNGTGDFILNVTDGVLGDTWTHSIYAHESGSTDYSSHASIDFEREGLTVHVDGSYSTAFTEVFWDFGDGSTSTKPIDSHTYAEPGDYLIRLRIQGMMFSFPAAIEIRVGYGNTPPKADFACEIKPQNHVSCDLLNKPDLEGDYLQIAWDMGDGNVEKRGRGPYVDSSTRKDESVPLYYRYAEPGVYTISATVSDGEYESSHSIQWDTTEGLVTPN